MPLLRGIFFCPIAGWKKRGRTDTLRGVDRTRAGPNGADSGDGVPVARSQRQRRPDCGEDPNAASAPPLISPTPDYRAASGVALQRPEDGSGPACRKRRGMRSPHACRQRRRATTGTSDFSRPGCGVRGEATLHPLRAARVGARVALKEPVPAQFRFGRAHGERAAKVVREPDVHHLAALMAGRSGRARAVPSRR